MGVVEARHQLQQNVVELFIVLRLPHSLGGRLNPSPAADAFVLKRRVDTAEGFPKILERCHPLVSSLSFWLRRDSRQCRRYRGPSRSCNLRLAFEPSRVG